MKYVVYQTINLINLKIYIGVHKTEDPDVFDGYIGCGIKINNPSSYMNPTTPLQFAVKKYGTKNFKRTILKIFDNPEDAYKLEQELVNHEFIKRDNVYNVKLGGEGGCSNYVRVYQYSPEGKLLKVWDSMLQASEFIGVSHTAILNAIKYKGSCKKYFWTKEKVLDFKDFTLYTGSLCYKYDRNGKYLDTYNSLIEAAKDNNQPIQSIQRAVKGGYKVGDCYYNTKLLELYKGKDKISLKNKPLYVYTLSGEYVTCLNSIEEIRQYFNLKSTSSITTAIRTERQYKNYQLSLEKVEKMNPIVDKRNTKKTVVCYTEGGELVEEFDSITKACEKYGTGVQKVLRGSQRLCKGYVFKYKS